MPRIARRTIARWIAALTVMACLGARIQPAAAHDGLPFPILMDRPCAGYVVSVWADPDVGTGTVLVFVDPPLDSDQPSEPEVEVWVQPKTGRLPIKRYRAERQTTRRVQYLATPQFDRQELWTVGVTLSTPAATGELQTDVEATPRGLGPWGYATYLLPFAALAVVWIVAWLSGRR